MMSDAQSHVNPFAAQQRLLIERLHIFLATLHPALYADVVRTLEAEGKLLFVTREMDTATRTSSIAGSWPLLTLLVAQTVAPDSNLTSISSVAVATECFICALDLLDDVEDEDQTPIVQALGIARTLNVSTTLLMLAQQAILSLAQHQILAERILHLLNAIQTSALTATTGQHRDLLAEQQLASAFTQEDCIEIARGKAGALMRLAFLLGAICAGADETTREQFAALGELLGIAHQLDNDAHDLYYLLRDYSSMLDVTHGGTGSIMHSKKTDLTRHKKTLPVVLAAQREEAILQEKSVQADEQEQEHLRVLQEGILTTWGISLLYRDRARGILQEIERRLPVSPLLSLLLRL
jgi:geranylgeranyl diphosphate synthase, type I